MNKKFNFFKVLTETSYQNTLAERQFGLADNFIDLAIELERNGDLAKLIGKDKQTVIKKYKKRISQIIGNGCKESLGIERDLQKLIDAFTQERLIILSSKDKKLRFKKTCFS